MIFITVGSQKFQFDRLLKCVDELIEKKIITEEVFAQSGSSAYVPLHYSSKAFLDRDEFREIMHKSNTVITHGGTGAIVGALKAGKKVIAVPRLEKYGEHVDNHQLQIIEEFSKSNLIEGCYNLEELNISIENLKIKKYNQYISNTQKYIDNIKQYLEEE